MAEDDSSNEKPQHSEQNSLSDMFERWNNTNKEPDNGFTKEEAFLTDAENRTELNKSLFNKLDSMIPNENPDGGANYLLSQDPTKDMERFFINRIESNKSRGLRVEPHINLDTHRERVIRTLEGDFPQEFIDIKNNNIVQIDTLYYFFENGKAFKNYELFIDEVDQKYIDAFSDEYEIFDIDLEDLKFSPEELSPDDYEQIKSYTTLYDEGELVLDES